MEKFKKVISSIILGAVILYAGYLVGYWTKYYVFQWKTDPARLYAKDTFGGKTPQETYEFFTSALRLDDIELASKYFILSKQSEKLKELRELHGKGELQKYIEGLPGWEETEEEEFWQEDVKKYLYSVNVKEVIEFLDPLTGKKEAILPGSYKNSIFFRLNGVTNVWKIDVL